MMSMAFGTIKFSSARMWASAYTVFFALPATPFGSPTVGHLYFRLRCEWLYGHSFNRPSSAGLPQFVADFVAGYSAYSAQGLPPPHRSTTKLGSIVPGIWRWEIAPR